MGDLRIDIANQEADRLHAFLYIAIGYGGLQVDRLPIPSEGEGRLVAQLRQQVRVSLGDVQAVGRGVQRVQGRQGGRGSLATQIQPERARGRGF